MRDKKSVKGDKLMKKKFFLGLSMLFFAVMFFAGSSYAGTPVYGTVNVSVSTSNQVSTTNGGVYIVNGGTLNVNNGVSFTNNIASGTLVQGGAVYVASGTVNLNTGASAITFSNNRDMYVSTSSYRDNDIYIGAGNLNVNGTGDASLNSGLAGAGTVNKTSGGNLTIANASGYSGTINISSGTSNIANKGAGAINYSVGTTNTFSGTTASGTTLANAGNLTYNRGINQGTISGTGNLTLTGSVTNIGSISQRSITNNGTLTSSLSNLTVTTGFITNQGTLYATGNSALNKHINGSGNLVLVNGATTNSSGYNIAQSVLQINAGASLSTNANSLMIGNSFINNGTLTLTGGTLDENMTGVSTSNTSFTGDVTLSGINSGNLGTMTLNGGNLTITDGYNLSMGSIVFSAANTLNVKGSDAVINNNFQSAGSNIKINNSGNLLLAGNITSTGGNFVKDGAGNMVFDEGMSNNYANTVIDSGTLSGYYHNIMGDISGAGGSVEFLDMYSSTTPVHFTKDIDLGGAFIKSGDAVFNVTSDVFDSDSINLKSGAFLANSDYITVANNVDVNNGAVLGGNGTITAAEVNINAGGTLNAGNSIDTLNIENAVLNFKDDSKYYVEIEQSDMYRGVGSKSDKVNVTGGTIEIHHGAQLEVYNTEIEIDGKKQGRYFVHESFEILTSSPSDLMGEFEPATVSGFDAFRIETDVEYDYAAGKAILNVKRIRTDYEHDVYGLSHNQKRTAKGIDSVSTGFGGDLINALLVLEGYHYYATDHAGLTRAFDDIAGSMYANALMAPYFHAKKSKVHDRIYLKNVDHKQHKENAVCYDCSHNLWVEYTGSFNRVDRDANSRRFTNTSNGVLAGYDRSSVVSNIILGAYAGYSKNELDQKNSAGSSDTIESDVFTAGMYGGMHGKKWDLEGIISASYFNNDSERKIVFMNRKAEASFDQQNVALDLKGAYKIAINKNMKVSPFAGFLTSYTNQEKIKEDGADSLNLAVDAEDSLVFEARLGVELKSEYKKFAWYVSAAASQMLTDGYGSVDSKLKDYPASFKDIRGADRGSTFFDYNLGAEYKFAKQWILFGDLQGDLSDSSVGYYGTLGVMFSW